MEEQAGYQACLGLLLRGRLYWWGQDAPYLATRHAALYVIKAMWPAANSEKLRNRFPTVLAPSGVTEQGT